MAANTAGMRFFAFYRMLRLLIVACAVVGCSRSHMLTTKSVGATQNAPVVRTDFSDDAAWRAIGENILRLDPQLQKAIDVMKAFNPSTAAAETPAFVDLIDDRQYAGMTPEQLLALVPETAKYDCLYIVDAQTVSQPEHPVLVVDVRRQRGRTFRTVPSEIQIIESNLSISNVDWEDFADDVDASGVFRGSAK